MQKLRDKTHIILWTLLIMFVLSMTIGGLVGGANIMDLFSKEKKLEGKAGLVSGNELDAATFSRAVQNELARMREEGQEITDFTIKRVSDQVWNMYITEILLNEQVREMGLEATDWEIYEYLVENPPAFLMQNEAFQTDGEFDREKYMSALTNPQGNEWLPIEQYLRTTIPFEKIKNLVQNLSNISEKRVHQEYLMTRVPYDIELLLFPFSIVKADTLPVSDRETEKYYESHKDDFYVQETRQLEFVFFELKPSPSDSESVYQQALNLKNRIEAGESFETVAIEYTEDPSGKNSGGDLGWFDREQMVAPFSKAAFSLAVGEISDPVLTRFGYHVITIEDKRRKGPETEIKARHILLKINPGPETIESIRSRANLFAFDANEYGFQAAADSHNLAIKTSNPITGEASFIQDLGAVPRAVNFAFAANTIGALSELIGTENGFVLLRLAAIDEAHYKPLDEVRSEITSKIRLQKQTEKLRQLAHEIYDQLDPQESLESARIYHDELRYRTHQNIYLNRPLPELSRSNSLIGTILALEAGQISQPVQVGNQFLIVKLLSSPTIDEDDYAVEKEVIRDRLEKQAKTNFYNQWLSALKEEADIIDNRDNMY